MNSFSTSKLFNHKPVIKFVPGTTDQVFEPVLTVHQDKVFYFGDNTLYSLDYESSEWKEEAPPPFKIAYGFTMTSTPMGLVVFGGCSDTKTLFTEAWIYSCDNWRPLNRNLPPRCFHASTWIPSLDALLISGGYDTKGFLGDFLLLDVKLGFSREFPLQCPLPFAFHTVTVITNNMLCLYGGKLSDEGQNNKTFLVNINDGSVRDINVFPFFEPRYLHRAFNFYGNLLVTGGYSETSSSYLINGAEINKKKGPIKQEQTSNANIPILFVFLHRVWLTLLLPESIINLIPDIGYMLPLSKGLILISPDGGQSSILYFNDSHDSFSGTKDIRYITFLNDLLHQNLNSLNLNPENSPVEAHRKELLEERRRLYLDISNKFGVEDLSFLINERDLLNRLLAKMKVEDSSSGNYSCLSSSPTSARGKNSITLNNISIPHPDETDYSQLKKNALESLQLMSKLKKEHKETLSITSKTVESLFQEVQLLKKQKGFECANPTNQNIEDVIQKVSKKNLATLNSEIDRTKYQFKSIAEQLDIYNKMKIDSSKDIIHVYEKIDSLLVERQKKKERLYELKKKYIKNSEETILKMAEIFELSKMNEGNEKTKKTEKSIMNSYDKFKSIKVDHRNFIEKLSEQISQLKAKIEKLLMISNFQSKEILRNLTNQISEDLNSISTTFNTYSKQFAPAEEKILLPEVKLDETQLAKSMIKHGRVASSSGETQMTQDALWNNFYTILNNIYASVQTLDESK